MEFIITRASDYTSKPCPEAYTKKGYPVGTWFINIHNLLDLKKFSIKYGGLILSENNINKIDLYKLTIYDDYVE